MSVRRKRRKNVRVITHRKISPGYVRQMNAIADDFLAKAESIYEQSSGFDTAVRDVIASGLAYILHAAYDCKACALGIENDEFAVYIDGCVAKWLRDREYTEWFCIAASRLFSTSDPRRLVREEMAVFKKAL